MRLTLLHVDDALESQPDFICACTNADAQILWVAEDASAIRLWGKQQELDDFRAALVKQLTGDPAEPRLTFMGSGDFHHITTFLVAFALENQFTPITIIH